jgi:hypothetical protein
VGVRDSSLTTLSFRARVFIQATEELLTPPERAGLRAKAKARAKDTLSVETV